MKAVGYQRSLPISDPDSLVDIELPPPVPAGRYLLVRVAAVSVNPIDTKMRMRAQAEPGQHKVLGWDASGVVEGVGPECKLFKPGDAVFYAGALTRHGTNSELHLVDERLVGPKPKMLDHARAAALPLTAITAWEALFDRLDIIRPVPGAARALVVVGGAGGVGSIAIQLAKQVGGVTVIATASRPESIAWARSLGADHVIDHAHPIHPQIAALGLGAPGFVFSTTKTDTHFDGIVETIAPQGRFCLIDDPEPIDVRKLKRKSVSLHWELMFTRSLFSTPDMAEQHRLLANVSALVDEGKIRSTFADHFGRITAENLKRAHAFIESGKARGKIVLEGF
jgi:zinc-binding alcohol dehydrogenase family protein